VNQNDEAAKREMTDQSDPARILKGIDASLRNKFEEIRKQSFNQNTKGYEYEKAVSNFLSDYLSSLFDFHTRVAVIDKDLKVFNMFKTGENDFDVVATFRNACPKIVLKTGDMEFIPFDAAAFFIEVKQTLTKESLEKDLSKLEKLNAFDCSKRFGVTFSGQFSVNRPIKTLFYYETGIAEETLAQILVGRPNSWDLLLRFSDDLLLGNCVLPVVKANSPSGKPILAIGSHSILNYILLTQSSMTFGPLADTMPTFLNLMAHLRG
jgi:hypothetical protein